MCVYTSKDDLCIPITMEELEKELQETRRGKASCLDGILQEILKLGGPKLKACLLSLYNTCWQRQTLPQDFKDALIITIHKRKGDRRNCDNHHGLSLLSIAGKVLAEIMLNRLIYNEVKLRCNLEQITFIKQVKHIFMLKEIDAMCYEKQETNTYTVQNDRPTDWQHGEEFPK